MSNTDLFSGNLFAADPFARTRGPQQNPGLTSLNDGQRRALELLRSDHNVFLTGAAGSGKSFLVRQFLREKNTRTFPVLASTGAAAVLVGGRTFHSFFGLGIMEGGFDATVTRGIENKRVVNRLKKTEGVIIDEVSLLSGVTLRAAETIARQARGNDRPWGGLRVVAVGDFAQLPPVDPFRKEKDWAFLDSTWKWSEFESIVLSEIMRARGQDHFLEVLNAIRIGQVTPKAKAFLEERKSAGQIHRGKHFDGTKLFGRRIDAEAYNLQRLVSLSGDDHVFETKYTGQEKSIQDFKRHAPIGDVIRVKVGALVMLRQNDVEGRWVNGSLGHIKKVYPNMLSISLASGREIEIERATFSLLNAEGLPVVSATNFPINLAYGITIHKAQGLTVDRLLVDLKGFWEPGQAYVALSRARSAEGLYLEDWDPRSILADPQVTRFHQALLS